IDCKGCRGRFRADHLEGYRANYRVTAAAKGEEAGQIDVELGAEVPGRAILPGFEVEGRILHRIDRIEFAGSPTPCPTCGNRDLTEPRLFNLLFRTHVGPIEDAASTVFLRPETAQGMFVNFENARATMRRKLPFGIAQVGR